MITLAAISACSGFGTGMGAILAVAGDVENRPEFLLKLQGLAHQLFRTGVVVDRGQHGERLFAGKENAIWDGAWCELSGSSRSGRVSRKAKGRGILPRPRFADS